MALVILKDRLVKNPKRKPAKKKRAKKASKNLFGFGKKKKTGKKAKQGGDNWEVVLNGTVLKTFTSKKAAKSYMDKVSRDIDRGKRINPKSKRGRLTLRAAKRKQQ